MCKRGQAASLRCVTFTATPSANFVPPSTASNSFGAFRQRNFFSAISRIFQINASALATFLYRLAASVRSRTAAERRLDNVRRAQVQPVGLGKPVERHHPLPVPAQRLRRLGVRLAVACHERIAQPLGMRLGSRRRGSCVIAPAPPATLSSASGRPPWSVGDSSTAAPRCWERSSLVRTKSPDAHRLWSTLHGFNPRSRRSRSTRAQDSLDSRCPLSTASTTLRPSRSAPMTTNSAAFVSASPAFT